MRRRAGILAYVAAVDALALIAAALVFSQHVDSFQVGTFLLATLVALAGATPVRIPALKTAVSATDPFVFTALAAYGPMPACVVAAAGVLGSMLGRGNDRQPMRVVFNLGNVVLSIAFASQVYVLTGGVPGGPLAAQIWPLVASSTVYFLINTGLVTTAIVVDTDRPFLSTWRDSGLWTAVSSYAGLTLSVGLLLALDLVGPSGLALGIPPCWLLAAFYRTHKERQEEQQRRIQQVEVLNLELEDKVVERTAELQRALSRIESANTQLRETNERLTDANRAKSEFLANVSHELRTPLNAIIGFSDLLNDPGFGQLTEQQREFVRDVHESGEHLLRLINEILDLSKIEAGKMEVHLEPVEIPQAVREAVAMLRPQAGKKDLTLEAEVAADVRFGRLDPGFFRQVLVNLLSNAVKFTEPGGRVRVLVRRITDDVEVVVEDSGIGIAPDDVGRIFDEFYQVDGSYARNYGGTGLGLALVRRMVAMQRGEIRVDSEPGRGSRFVCRYRNVAMDDHVEIPRVPQAAPGAEAPTHDGAPPEILVVEDNPVNRKLARNVLRSKGYVVHEATTGEEALTFLEHTIPDLILMDLQLPGLDGLEITRRVRADSRTGTIPIVALTAHAHPEDEQRAREAGCVGYISKPIRLANFPSQVGSFLADPVGSALVG